MTGELVEVPDTSAQYVLKNGETVISYTPGGGGYGPPHERDPARVGKDVAEGWISVQRAHNVYGVVVDDQGNVDEQASRALRADP